MPKFCKTKAERFSESYITALVFERSCDVLIAFFGIDPGSENDTPRQYLTSIGLKGFNFSPCGFQFAIFVTTLVVAFFLGFYVRY